MSFCLMKEKTKDAWLLYQVMSISGAFHCVHQWFLSAKRAFKEGTSIVGGLCRGAPYQMAFSILFLCVD